MHSAVESSIGLASRFTSAARMLALVTPPDVSRSFTTPPTWGARPAPSHLFHERVARDPTPCQTFGRATRGALRQDVADDHDTRRRADPSGRTQPRLPEGRRGLLPL